MQYCHQKLSRPLRRTLNRVVRELKTAPAASSSSKPTKKEQSAHSRTELLNVLLGALLELFRIDPAFAFHHENGQHDGDGDDMWCATTQQERVCARVYVCAAPSPLPPPHKQARPSRVCEGMFWPSSAKVALHRPFASTHARRTHHAPFCLYRANTNGNNRSPFSAASAPLPMVVRPRGNRYGSQTTETSRDKLLQDTQIMFHNLCACALEEKLSRVADQAVATLVRFHSSRMIPQWRSGQIRFVWLCGWEKRGRPP